MTVKYGEILRLASKGFSQRNIALSVVPIEQPMPQSRTQSTRVTPLCIHHTHSPSPWRSKKLSPGREKAGRGRGSGSKGEVAFSLSGVGAPRAFA